MRLYDNYTPARLVKGDYRWYIEYYAHNPTKLAGTLDRFRETYRINAIKDLKAREEKANEYIAEINRRLPHGFPFNRKDLRYGTNIIDALGVAEKIKCATDRIDTIRQYESIKRLFCGYLEDKGKDGMMISQFGVYEASEFMEYVLLERNVGPYTYNNYIIFLRALFNVLVKKKYLEENPFLHVEKKKAKGKKRRAFSSSEITVMVNHIRERDPIMMLCILLQYHCFIRPGELRRLRVGDVDIEQGMIILNSSQTKNKNNGIVTIPDSAIQGIEATGLLECRKTYLIFGERLRPHPLTACGERSLNARHRTYLKQLQKKGLLGSIEGLSVYSWKDTGATRLVKDKVNIMEIMRQMRHSDLSYTQRYCESLYVLNKEIKHLDNTLM